MHIKAICNYEGGQHEGPPHIKALIMDASTTTTTAPVVPDPPAPQAPPNNATQQQLFQMHQTLAQHQISMTMMTQLA